MAEEKFISKVKIGTTNYYIKDEIARSSIEALAKGGTHFIGLAKGYNDIREGGQPQPLSNELPFTTSYTLVPYSTEPSSLIRDNTNTLKYLMTGDIVSIKGSGNSSEGKEFIFVQTDERTKGVGTWYELGANLGAFAYANKGTGQITSQSSKLIKTDIKALSGNKYVSSIDYRGMSPELVTVGTLDPEKVGDGTGGTLNELIGRISWRDDNVPVYATVNEADECLNLNMAIMDPDTIDITTTPLSTGQFTEEPSGDKSYGTILNVISNNGVNREDASSVTVATGSVGAGGTGAAVITGISAVVEVNPSAS